VCEEIAAVPILEVRRCDGSVADRMLAPAV
jgi:hypothetical protein